VIDGCDEGFGGAEAEGAMADGFNLVVHSFYGVAGEAMLGPCQNPVDMPA